MVKDYLSAFYDALQNFEEDEQWQLAMHKAELENPWFTKQNIVQSLGQWQQSLSPIEVQKFEALYDWQKAKNNTKTLGIIMAGNIPVVGMHDLLMGLCCGFKVHAKLSSLDKTLISIWVQKAIAILPQIKHKIHFVDSLKDIDSLVVTGSDNTAQTFNQYFNKTDRILRQNRNSLAIVTGNETNEELAALGYDIFSYFGLGCRNVTHILVPLEYNFKQMIESWGEHTDIINHNKYANNYTYHKALLLMNLDPHIDFGFGILHNNTSLYSPVSITHYSHYQNEEQILDYINQNSARIQCIIGKGYLPFGSAQNTYLNHFADGVNTVEHWLQG